VGQDEKTVALNNALAQIERTIVAKRPNARRGFGEELFVGLENLGANGPFFSLGVNQLAVGSRVKILSFVDADPGAQHFERGNVDALHFDTAVVDRVVVAGEVAAEHAESRGIAAANRLSVEGHEVLIDRIRHRLIPAGRAASGVDRAPCLGRH